jgi:hypothetical protein
MKQSDAYKFLIREYLQKCHACNEFIAEHFCIRNNLCKAREPREECEIHLKLYLLVKGEKE